MTAIRSFYLATSICLAVVVLFSFLPETYQARGYDWQVHYDKARGLDRGGVEDFDLTTYPPLSHFLGSPFAFRERSFYIYLLLLIGFITPMLIFLLSGKEWVSVLFYFTTSSYFYFMEHGLIPQALVGILILVGIVVKDWRVRVALLPLGLLAHSVGLQAVGVSLIVLFIFENKIYRALPFFPGCSGFFGKARPDELMDTKIIPASETSRSLRVSYLLRLLVDIFPLPFLLLSARELWRERKDLLALMVVYILLGVIHFRVFFFVPLVGIPGLVLIYKKFSRKHKKWLLAFALFYGAIQVYWWANYKLSCFPLY